MPSINKYLALKAIWVSTSRLATSAFIIVTGTRINTTGTMRWLCPLSFLPTLLASHCSNTKPLLHASAYSQWDCNFFLFAQCHANPFHCSTLIEMFRSFHDFNSYERLLFHVEVLHKSWNASAKIFLVVMPQWKYFIFRYSWVMHSNLSVSEKHVQKAYAD